MAKKKKESFEEYKKRTQKESIKTNTGEKESFESFMKKRQKNMSTEYGAYMDRADILKSIAEGRKNSIDKDKAYSNESWNRYYNRQVDEVMEKGKEAKKSFGYSKKTKGYRDSIDKTNSSLKDTSIQLKNRSDIEAKELEEKQNKEIAGNIAENAYDIAMKKVFGFNRDTLREEQERKDAQARKDAMDKLRGKSQTQTFVNDKYAGQGLRSLMGKMDNESKRRQEMRNNIYSATENEEKNWSVEDTSKKIKELEQKREEKAEERWKIEKGKEYGMSDDDNRSDDLQYEMNYIDDEINRLNQIKSEKHNEKMSNALNEVSKEGNKLIEEVGKQDFGEEFIENGLSDEDKAVLQKHGVSWKEAKEWKTEQYYAKEDAIRESAIKGATEEHPVLMSIASVGAGMVSPMQDIPEVLNAKMNNRGIDVSRMSLSNSRDDVRDTASDMTGSEVGRFLYQTGMSMADFLAAAPTGNAATFIMGSTAGVSALKDAKERGVSDDKAILTGIASGVAEGFFEKFSLENLKALQATGKSGLKNMVKDVAKQSFTEGSEEFFTDISNAITDGLINGGLSDYETNVKAYMLSGMSEQEARMQASKNFAKQLGMSFAGGALSGGVMGAGKVGLNSLSEYKSIGKDIKEKGEVESLLDTAAGIDGTLDTEKVNVQSDKEIGKLAKKTIENIETQLSDASSQEELDKTYEVLVEKTKNPTIQSELAPIYEMAKRRISESSIGNNSESVETQNNSGVDLRQMAQEVADRQIESRRAERGVQRNGMENMTSTMRGVSNPQNTADESRSMTNSAQNQFNEQSVENSQKLKYGQNTESNIMLSQNTNTAAVNLDTGAPAVVERFTNVGREDATVQLSDGSEMPLSNLTMQDRRTQQVMNAAAALDSTPAANVFVEDYRSDVPIATYTEACYRLYNAGRAGVTNADMVIRQIAGGTNVPKATLLKMHAIGLNQMKAEKEAETKTNVTRRAQGNVVDNREDVGDSDILKRVAKKIAEKTGQDINLEKVLEHDANGTYKAGQGMISISENANNAIATIIHETQEFAYENNREGMDKFIDTFLDYMAEEKGYAIVERMLQAYHSTYTKVEGDTTVRQAAKEMVFDAAGGLFADDKGIENFTSWLNENEDMSTEQKKSVLQSLADFFRDMIEKMKEYMKNHHLNMAASQAMSLEIETKEKLREQLMEAIDKAGENYKKETGQQEDVATSQEEREQVNEKKEFSLEVDTEGRTLTKEQKEFFKDSKVVNEDGNLKVMYHGTGRADRVGYYFDPNKATSGPMAYFTDDKRIAENYSRDKDDTSIAYDERYDSYYTQFRVNRDGQDISIGELWNRIPIHERNAMKEKAGHIKFDDNYENIIYDENVTTGNGNFDSYLLREHKGNVLEALVDSWLESGDLYGEENWFKDVLKLLGISDVQYLDPEYRDEKVYEVYLNVTNPLNTSNISEDMIKKIQKAAESAERTEGNQADMWDKRNVKPETFVERLKDDVKNGTTNVWTSIPDFVTDVLKDNGFDGIIDTGGKTTNVEHTVVIPFYSNQIKEVTNTNPTKENQDIRYSLDAITDVNDENYYTYDNLIKLEDMDIRETKLHHIEKDTPRAEIINQSLENVKKANGSKEDNGKLFINNKQLGDIRITRGGIRHSLSHRITEQRSTAVLNLNSFLQDAIVINKADGKRNEADGARILIGVMRDENNIYFVRTTVNEYMGQDELNSSEIIYAMATKKEPVAHYRQKSQSKSDILTGSDKISIKDLLDIVKKHFPNELPKDVAEKLGYERGKSDIEGLRHSLEVTVPTKDIVAENKHLQEMVQFLKEEFAITGGTQPSRSQIEKVSRKIIRDTSSKYDSKILVDNLIKLYEYLHSENANQEEGLKIASEIARGVLEESVLKDTSMYETYKPMREYFRKTKIKLSEGQKKEVAHLYGSYGAFRKQNMGRLNLSDSGVSLDTIYGELSNMYPEFFSYGTNEGDQPFTLVDALDAIQPQIRSVNQEDMDTYAYELAGTIFKEISDVQARETFADKKEKEKREALEKLSKKYEKKVEEIKKQSKDTYHENMKKESESYHRANIETQRRLQEQIKELEISLKGAGPEVVQDLKIEIAKKNEQIRALKGNYSTQIANMKAKMTHSQKMRRQNMQRTEFKNSIRKNCRKLNRLLVKPTDKNHVPEPLQKSLMEFVAGIDLIDDNESNSSMQYMDIVNCMRDIRDKLDNYEKGKQSDEWEKYYIEVDPDYVEMLGQSIKDMEATVRISDMTLEQLANLDLVVKGAAKMVSTVNTMFENGKYENIEALGKASISELEEHKSKKGDIPFLRSIDKMLNTEMLTPREFFETLGDSATSIYDEIRQGFNRRVWDIKKAQEFMEKETKDVDMKKITKKVHTFTVGSQKFKMTTGQLMELYCLSKRKQALGHIVSGGIKINEFSEKGKVRKNKKSEVINMKEASLQRILSKLSPEEKALADHMQEFLSTECSDWGNDVSMKMYGYRKFTEKNYYPIKSESNQTPTNESNKSVGDQSGFYRIKNQGMTKATTEGANNTIVISDIFDTFTQHVTNMASYHAYCVPLSDAMRWYNYRYTEKDADGFVKSHSIKEEMERVYGKKAKDYFEQLLLDINGESSRDNRAEISDKMLANWKVASVAGNMRVVIQQPTAYIRAANVMNPKYMSKAVTMKPAIKESQEKSAIAQWKAWGYYDTMIGKSMKEVITGESSIADKIRDKTTILAGKADDLTWGVIYNAVKLEIKDTRPDLKEGTVEFDEAVARRYDDVIDKTQVVDTVLNKPGYMRSKNAFHRLTGSFMAEPMLTYNMMRKSLVDVYYKKPEALEKLGRTAAVFGVQCVVNAAAQSIIDAIRSDDDDDYWKKWVNALSGNILDNANPLSMIPYAKDIVSMFQGYELKRSDMEGISLLVNSITEIVKEPEIISDIFTGDAFTDKKKYRKFKNIVNGLSKTTGLPLYNLYRDMVEPVMKLVNGGPLVNGSSSGDVYEDYYDSIAGEGAYEKKKESEEKETSGNTSLHIAQLMEAIREKDNEKEKELRKKLAEEGNTEQDVTKKLRTALGKADPRIEEAAKYRISGDTSAYVKVANEIIADGFSHSLVMESINNKINSLKSKSSDDEKEDSVMGEKDANEEKEEVVGWYTNMDIVSALDNGQETGEIIDDIVSTQKENGKTDKQIEQSIRSSLSSAYREKYKEGDYSVKQDIIKKLTGVRVNGKQIFLQGTGSIFDRWNKETKK